MNGRELTAQDIEYNFHRMLGLGSGFTERSEPATSWRDVQYGIGNGHRQMDGCFQAEGATPRCAGCYPRRQHGSYIPPEVIKEHGDVTDWRNLVGTGPFMLTDWVEGSSITWDQES